MNDTAKKVPVEAGKKEAQTPDVFREWGVLDSLLLDVDRAMDAVRRRFWRSPMGRTVTDVEPFLRSDIGWAVTPVVDIVEKDKQYLITAELPGLDPDNIELKIANNTLTIKGEKKQEREEKRRITISPSGATALSSAPSLCRREPMQIRSRQVSRTVC